MKSLKRIIAVLLVAVLALSFCGCHKKGETAVKVGDFKFDSGYYACALLEADQEARARVYADFTDAGKDTTDIKYTSQKIDGTKYTKWVENRAFEICKEIAAYKAKCAEAKLTLDEKNVSAINRFITDYWDTIFCDYSEPNGIGKDNFVQFHTDYANENSLVMQVFSSLYQSWYQSALQAMQNGNGNTTLPQFNYSDVTFEDYKAVYFDFLYGEKGSKKPADKELNEQLLKDYVLAGELTVDLTETDEDGNTTPLSDDAKKAKVKQINGYVKELEAGTSFDEIMHKFEGAAEGEEHKHEAVEGEVAAITEHATPIYKEDAYYDEVSALEIGKATVIGLKDDGTVEDNATQLILLYRLDLAKDVHYVNELRTGDSSGNLILHNLKDAELDAEIQEYLKTVKSEKVTSSTKQFDVKKIKYPKN